MSESPRIRYRQHLEVETPEHVVLDYEIAGIGSRALAKFLDGMLILIIGFALALSLAIWREISSWVIALQILFGFGLFWGYFTLWEGLMRGRTPGKRWMGIRMIRDTGHGAGFGEAALRNLLLPADAFGFAGAFFIALHPQGKRLGDLVAGTVVVRDHPTRRTPAIGPEPVREAESPSRRAAEPGSPPELSDPEFRLLREFLQRERELPRAAVERHTRAIAARLAPRFPDRPADDLQFLRELYREELARRQGRLGGAGRGQDVKTSRRLGVSAVERMIARKSVRWAEFERLAGRVSKDGLDSLGARELPDFAARYREVAADLARARTYRADSTTLARLERLVAAGHSALYRSDRHTWQGVWTFFTRECPAAVVESRGYVATAAGVFLVAALAGYGLLREKPDLAPALLPDLVLERAEAGRERTQSGQGYVVSDRGDRPIVASSIITNNIGVAFQCFAGGIFLGVGALIMLAYNGVFLGAVSGHFQNAGLLGYLWTFVVGHSVLELFAIWVAGAAGFLLGRALIAPGRLTRSDALVLAGRRAVRMVGAAMVLLVIAGVIEGFVSAGEFPLELRLAVSGASVVFLGLYLLNASGKREARSEKGSAN